MIMKKLILLLFLAFNCTAEEKVRPLDICDNYENIARSIMTGRQDKMPMSKMIKLADKKLTLDIIEMAYDRPAFSAKRNKEASINKFANDVYLVCYKEINKRST